MAEAGGCEVGLYDSFLFDLGDVGVVDPSKFTEAGRDNEIFRRGVIGKELICWGRNWERCRAAIRAERRTLPTVALRMILKSPGRGVVNQNWGVGAD
jgi:hypothetical protein